MRLWLIYLFSIKAICISPSLASESKMIDLWAKRNPTPIVLWHGMGDTCCVSFSLGYVKQFLEKYIPGVYVHSIRIGNNTIEDFESGYFVSPNKQVDYVCKKLKKNPLLKNGFNAIGYSQGSQFLRAVVQRCGHTLPPIKTLISMGGQHQGIYGLPHCGALQHASCDYIRKMLNYAAYAKIFYVIRSWMELPIFRHSYKTPSTSLPRWMQESLVQATYWHDPLNETVYQKNSEFLSDINNERFINNTYVENLYNLKKFVLVKFSNDTIVQPRDTEWFGFYAPGQSEKLITLQESRIYTQDRLGLRKMDKAGKLVFLAVNGDHLRYSDEFFINEIIKPYLA